MSADPDFIHHCRMLGEMRLKIARESKSMEEWQKNWRKPSYDFPFTFGPWWNMTVEYQVPDFAAEVGFFTDVLALSINALDAAYAMFTGPNEEFHLSISPCPVGSKPTPPNAFKFEFMVDDLMATANTLRMRGIVFEAEPARFGGPESKFLTGFFRTPNGIRIALWSMKDNESTEAR